MECCASVHSAVDTLVSSVLKLGVRILSTLICLIAYYFSIRNNIIISINVCNIGIDQERVSKTVRPDCCKRSA